MAEGRKVTTIQEVKNEIVINTNRLPVTPISQTGHNCKITAIAMVENYYTDNLNLTAVPLHKQKTKPFSIRKISKQSRSVQGELLELSQMEEIVGSLGYQSELINFYNNYDLFKQEIIKNIESNNLIIACFSVDRKTHLPTTHYTNNEHAAIINGYNGKNDTIQIIHWGKERTTTFSEFYYSSLSLPEQRNPEYYHSIKDKNRTKKYELNDIQNDDSMSSQKTKKSITPRVNSGFRGKFLVIKEPSLENLLKINEKFADPIRKMKRKNHQTIILNNIKWYLQLCYEENYTKKGLPIPNEFKKILSFLDDGHCFGFSLIHAAMYVKEMNKLLWWHYVLDVIATCNHNPLSLKQKIAERSDYTHVLPTLTQKEQQELLNSTVQDLFLKAAYYIIYHQAKFDSIIPFLPANLSQQTLLEANYENTPNTSLFEVVDAMGNILTIKDRQIIAVGHYSDEDIAARLSTNPHIMYLIHNSDHGIHLGVYEGQWFVYDPNYEKNKDVLPQFYYLLYFPDKKAAINEITRILGSDIVIEAVSLSQMIPTSPLTLNDEMMMNYIKNHLSEATFHLLPYYEPTILNKLIACLLDPINTNEMLTLKKLLAGGLLQQNASGFTGLQMIVRYSPDAFKKLMTYINKDDPSPEGQQIKINFARALSDNNEDGMTGLHVIARYAPHAITQLIDIIEKDTKESPMVKVHFLSALARKNNNDWTGLQMIARYAPNAITQLIAYMKNDTSSEWLKINIPFARALAEKNNEGETVVHTMARIAADETLIQLIDYIENNFSADVKEIKLNFSRALVEKDNEGWTGLHMIVRYADDEVLTQLIALLEKDSSPEIKQLKINFIHALITKNNNGRTMLQMIVDYVNADVITKLINFIEKEASPESKEVKAQYVNIIEEKIKGSDAIFQILPMDTFLTADWVALYAPFTRIKYLKEHTPHLLEIDSKLGTGLTIKEQAIADVANLILTVHKSCYLIPFNLPLLSQLISEFDYLLYILDTKGMTDQVIKKISATFPYPQNIAIANMINYELLKLDPQQALANELQQGIYANMYIIFQILLDPRVNLDAQFAASKFTFAEQIVIHVVTRMNYITPQELQIILNKVGSRLNNETIQKIACSFDGPLQNKIKTWIYQEMIKNELMQISSKVPNLDILLTGLSQGKEIWEKRYNDLPYYDKSGQPIYLSIAEQVIAYACLINNPELLKTIYDSFKSENINIDEQMIQKIASTFVIPENCSKWINDELAMLKKRDPQLVTFGLFNSEVSNNIPSNLTQHETINHNNVPSKQTKNY